MASASMATLIAEVDGSAGEHATAAPRADRVHDGLKVVAVIAMTIDHAGTVLLDHDSELFAAAKLVGRIAWPIFAVVMGTALARAQAAGRMPALARRYVLQLTAWGVLAWPLSTAALGSPQPNILLGLAGTAGLALMAQSLRERLIDSGKGGSLATLLLVCLAAVLAGFTSLADYGLATSLIVLALWVSPARCRLKATAIATVIPMIWHLTSFAVLPGVAALVAGLAGIVAVELLRNPWPASTRLAPTWAWYAFYPAHLAALLAVASSPIWAA